MTQDQLLINGDLLRLRREARGWLLNDMATRACMSVKQIRQLEEGGMSSFYSEAVKVTAAKKVGALLGLTANEVFAQEAAVSAEPESELDSSVSSVVQTSVDVSPESESEFESSEQPSAPSIALAEESKPKTSLWVVAGLFVAALLVAAYLQPQDEPVAAEPAPPLQTVPTDVTDAASAASSAETPTAEVVASSAIAASASRAVLPVVSASVPVVVRSASSSAVVTPAASAASK
jgi:transcriptional regulator with XRE-family HTH domain